MIHLNLIVETIFNFVGVVVKCYAIYLAGSYIAEKAPPDGHTSLMLQTQRWGRNRASRAALVEASCVNFGMISLLQISNWSSTEFALDAMVCIHVSIEYRHSSGCCEMLPQKTDSILDMPRFGTDNAVRSPLLRVLFSPQARQLWSGELNTLNTIVSLVYATIQC